MRHAGFDFVEHVLLADDRASPSERVREALRRVRDDSPGGVCAVRVQVIRRLMVCEIARLGLQPASGTWYEVRGDATPRVEDAMTIVIIGAGFCGTATAVHLLRAGAADVRVVLVDRSDAMGGVAYATRSNPHVLNVPAGNMSALDDDPDSFVRFVRRQGFGIDGGAFVRRALYGRYLEWLLRDAADRAPAGALERRTGDVTGIELVADRTAAVVSLRDGTRLRADHVVLAVGHAPTEPVDLPGAGAFWSSRRYVADPWRPDAFADDDPDRPLLCIGTGLSMVDVVLERWRRGARGGCIAISRHGLLPRPHRQPTRVPDPLVLPAELFEMRPPTVRGYCRLVRRAIDAAADAGVDWRDVMAALRPVTPALWRALPLDERRRWLRHVRPFWDVHRHRLAPDVHREFQRLQQDGYVRVCAARLVALREDPDGASVALRHRGTDDVRELAVGTVVNCMGPTRDTHRLSDPMLTNMCAQGLLRPDPLGLGLDTTHPILHYIGPFLRARDWEATAVPELRQSAKQLAASLLESRRSLADPNGAHVCWAS